MICHDRFEETSPHSNHVSISPYETNRSAATDLFYEKQTSYRPFYRLQSLFSVCIRRINPYATCRSAEGLSQVCHRSVQSYSRPIWRKTEVCKSAYCLWQTSHENDFFFDCVLPFILFAASLLQTFRDFWWLCNKDLLLCLHLICSRRCADNHPHETCSAVQRHKIASK